jgi:hypothetical protein
LREIKCSNEDRDFIVNQTLQNGEYLVKDYIPLNGDRTLTFDTQPIEVPVNPLEERIVELENQILLMADESAGGIL